MDNLSRKERCRTMAAVKSSDTSPEMVVRRGLHALGFRYRLHVAELPGKPDLVLPLWRAVIFVDGCFWHGHGCSRFRFPASRIDYWGPKITRNRQRDRSTSAQLRRLGWRVLRVWECELADNGGAAIARLATRLRGR
jgi:DNA mismatch endonuclease, patch repair protein